MKSKADCSFGEGIDSYTEEQDLKLYLESLR